MFDEDEDDVTICWDCEGFGYYDDEDVDEDDCTCNTCYGEGFIDG